MENRSVEEMLAWLKVEPRTMKWDSIVAYDRSKTNTVLLQEYIGRFSTGDYQDPITEEIADNTTPTQKEFIVDYVMDKPRLSFANSSLENSKAQMEMKVIGGTHLTFSKPEGAPTWNISKVAEEDALDGPRLLCDIDLTVNAGSVSSAGQVELRLDGGTNYRLTYVETPHLQRVAGERIKQRFSALPAQKKTFVLNELKFTADQFLKPKEFFIRTHNKKGSGARLLNNEDEGEGAVLLFITMEGGTNGLFPANNRSLRYLIPDDHSASVLLGNNFLGDRIFAEGLKKISNSTEVKYDTESASNGKLVSFIARSGSRKRTVEEKMTYQGVTYTSPYTVAGLHTSSDLDFFRMWLNSGTAADGIRIRWKEVEEREPIVYGPGNITDQVSVKWDITFNFDFQLDSAAGNIVLARNKNGEILSVTANSSRVPLQPGHHAEVDKGYAVWMKNLFEDCVTDFVSPIQEINIFTLNSLIFRGGNQAVKLDSVHFPTDLALFGQVGPNQTAFTLNRLEQVIGHSGEFKFETVPPRSGVTWKVESIPGNTGNPGTINATTGLYKAPTAAQLEGGHTRVRVTATAGSYSSSGLVSVLRRDITINPLVQVATAGDTRGREMSAGTLDGGALTWYVDPASGARVQRSTEPDGDHTYFPGPLKAGTGFSVDRIEVTNPRTRNTEYSTVVLLHGVPILTLAIDSTAGLPANKVQLVVVGNDGKPIAPGVMPLTWEVLAGSGQVHVTSGVFTVDPAGTDKFAVIITTLPSAYPGLPDNHGYIILPLPLFSVPETIRMLSLDGQ